MEMTKRSAAIVAVCALLFVMQVQQVAAMSKFCACYVECYPACRKNVLRFACVPFCANKCSPSQTTAVAGDDSCWANCAVKICGLEYPSAEEAGLATCAQNCNKKRSRILSSLH